MGEQLERTIEVVGELREVLVEGRTLLKDMRQERKKLERLMKQSETHIEDYASDHIDAVITKVVEDTVTALGVDVRKTQEQLSQQIIKAFGELTNNLMYGNSQGRGENVLERAVEAYEAEQRKKRA